MDGRAWLDDVRSLYRRYKSYCERAAAQISDEDFFTPLAGSPNSIAVLMKHLGGNHRSRWRDFLTTDGEKRDRDRESEFQIVQLARHFAADAWETLSIAPGKSEEYNAAMRAKHGDWWAREDESEAGS